MWKMIKCRPIDEQTYKQVRKAILTPQPNDEYDYETAAKGPTLMVLCLLMPITVGSRMRKTCQRKNLDAVINTWVRYGHHGKLSQILMFA